MLLHENEPVFSKTINLFQFGMGEPLVYWATIVISQIENYEYFRKKDIIKNKLYWRDVDEENKTSKSGIMNQNHLWNTSEVKSM